MEKLHNGYLLDFPEGVFPLSTDSMVLAHFVNLPKNSRVLDLCSGCGVLGHLLCAKDASCQVSGVEIDPVSHAAAVSNIERNHLSIRLSSICGDIRNIPSLFPAQSFSACVANPPYYAAGPESAYKGARREDTCALSDLFAAANWAVKYGGDFSLVHKPERLGEIFALADKYGFAPKRLGLVRHREGAAVSLVLVQCRKGGKQGLNWEEWMLHDSVGAETPLYREIYHI